MERLTYRTELGVSIDKNEDCPTCSICWDCDIPPRKCVYISDALKKLADYEDLEEQGRLVKLPCKVGDVVYFVHHDRVISSEVLSVKYHAEAENHGVFIRERLTIDVEGVSAEIDFGNIGKTVFLTEPEARAKLKRIERWRMSTGINSGETEIVADNIGASLYYGVYSKALDDLLNSLPDCDYVGIERLVCLVEQLKRGRENE